MSTNYTNFIANDLRTRITAGTCTLLSQRDLAKHYGTSTRPVGQALEQLIDEGYLKRQDNGRLALSKQLPTPTQATTERVLSPDTLRKDIESALILESMRGRINFLREEKIAQQFHVGRTALRNIFSEISLSGLISHTPRKGWQLREFHEKDLNDFLAVREQLELMALDAAKEKLETKYLRRFLEANQEPQNNGIEDNDLHQYIIHKANNHYMSSFFEHHAPFYELLFTWEAKDQHMRKEARTQHCDILEHLINKKWNLAKKSLSHHIWNNHDLLLATVRKMKNKKKGPLIP